MKIINTIDRQVEFVSIKVGECFMYDNCLFVKMNPVKVTECSPNAYCFVDNSVANVPQSCLVIPVDAEIVIKSKGAT